MTQIFKNHTHFFKFIVKTNKQRITTAHINQSETRETVASFD